MRGGGGGGQPGQPPSIPGEGEGVNQGVPHITGMLPPGSYK